MAHARRLLEEMRNRDSAGPGVCQPQSQSLELVITSTGDVCDAASETANDDKDEFRTLADSIMEEFAITSDEDDGDDDDGDEQAEAPTFTFPGKEQDASSATIQGEPGTVTQTIRGRTLHTFLLQEILG